MTQYFTKLLKRLPASSIWDQGDDVLRLWIYLLCIMDEDGVAVATRSALGRGTMLPDDRLDAALEKLMAPDPESTSPDAEGRRLQNPEQNIWLVTTAAKVRSSAPSGSDSAIRMRRWREQRKVDKAKQRSVTSCVTSDENRLEQNRTEEKKKGRKRPPFVKPSAEVVRAYCLEKDHRIDAEAFVDFYESKGWRVGNQPMKDWQAAVRTWAKRQAADPRAAQSTVKAKTTRELFLEQERLKNQPPAAGGGMPEEAEHE
jgi:hypothetical protein